MKKVLYAICLLIPAFGFAGEARSSFNVTVRYTASRSEEELFLLLKQEVFLHYGHNDLVFKAKRSPDGLYHFAVNAKQANGQFILSKLKDSTTSNGWSANKYIFISPEFFWEINDDVRIDITKIMPADMEGDIYLDNVFTVDGKSSLKYQLQLDVDSAYKTGRIYHDEDMYDSLFNFTDANWLSIKKALSEVENKRAYLSDDLYNKIKVKILFQDRNERFDGIKRVYRARNTRLNGNEKVEFIKKTLSGIYTLFNQYDLPPSYLVNSDLYLMAYFRRLRIKYELLYDKSQWQDSLSKAIRQQTRGILRDRLFVLLFKYTVPSANVKNLCANAIKTCRDSAALVQLVIYRDNALPGKLAYDFKLLRDNDEAVKLSDYRGRLVILDFWYTGCGACALMHQNVLKDLETIYGNDPRVVFMNITADRSMVFWRKSLQRGIYSSERSINLFGASGNQPNNDSIRVIDEYAVDSYPTLVIIRPDGRIVRYYRFLPSDYNKMREELKMLISVNLN